MYNPSLKSVICLLLILNICKLYAQSIGNENIKYSDNEDLTQYVDPLIGTAHCRWFHFAPGANPFGMAKPGPSTNGHMGNRSGWQAVGYDFRHNSIEGFPNFHENQIGGIVFMPTTGNLITVPGSIDSTGPGYRSAFDKKDELIHPGYYSVILKKYGITAELTSTKRVSYHRYSFPEGKQSNILFDIGNQQGESGKVKDARVMYTGNGLVEGYVETTPAYVNKYQAGSSVIMYFSAEIDKQPVSFGIFHGSDIRPGENEASGVGAGLYLTFDTKHDERIVIKAGLSYTSVENARQNLLSEASGLSFDEAREMSKKSWNALLGRIRIEGKIHADKVKFYTGLYHALLGRGLASDVNGAYPRNNGTIGRIPFDSAGQPLHNLYNTDAIWGTQWNLIQLWALVYPEYLSDFIQSHLLVYKDAGWLGDGIAASKFISGVGTNQVPLAIVAAYMCGIRDFDIREGYSASLKNEITSENRVMGAGKMDVGQFVKFGYVPYVNKKNNYSELWKFSCSHTLEYSYTAYAVAEFARCLGKKTDYKLLMDLSKGWEKIFNPNSRLMWPKLENGEFLRDFDPKEAFNGFQEGNAYQYTLYVPHNPQGIIAKVGRDEFNNRLDSIFLASEKDLFGGGKVIDAFAGINKFYNHGNQPCLHYSWLFNFSGMPSRTQKWVRAICNDFYGTEGIHGYGYGQDEDQGQLGGWYVMAGIGLFDVKGLTARNSRFGVGSPLFDKITIYLNQKYYPGDKFIIETESSTADNLYIQSMAINGKHLSEPFIPFSTVVAGGKLTIQLGSLPKNSY